MAYVGTPIDTQNQFQSLQGKRFDGDGSTTDFTLDIAPSSTLDIEVFVENVRQDPNSAYSISGTTLTFTGAPPSGTNNIYVVHQAKAVGTIDLPEGALVDLNGGSDKLVLDADGDTTISADTDDQIDIKTGGTDRAAIDASGRVIVGSTSNVNAGNTTPRFQVQGTDYATTSLSLLGQRSGTSSGPTLGFARSRNGTIGSNTILQENDEFGKIRFFGDDGNDLNNYGAEIVGAVDAAPGSDDMPGRIVFGTTADGATASTERMRIGSDGKTFVGKSSSSLDTAGVLFNPGGTSHYTSTNADVLYLNRKTSDGTIVGFYQDGTLEGYIVVSGSTVSYSGFTGTHWSRLADNSKPTILRGTIMESLDEMCDWYGLNYVDDEVNKYHYVGSLPEGKNVGDSHTVTIDGTEFTGTLVKEDDIKHTKAKVSDTEASKLVYGLFVTWDEEDNKYNDMLIAQTGTYVIRIHKDETVSKGDLIQSKGDGTGKVQADDIMRSSTVAKVLSTTKIETYSDGSYIVPCSLHC